VEEEVGPGPAPSSYIPTANIASASARQMIENFRLLNMNIAS
jgi:hypothetical protein